MFNKDIKISDKGEKMRESLFYSIKCSVFSIKLQKYSHIYIFYKYSSGEGQVHIKLRSP